MEVIYADVLAAVNFGIDYLLLAATVRLAGLPFVRRRLVSGAVVGAIYAVFTILPLGAFACSLPIWALSGFIMIRIACGNCPKKQLAKLFLLFLLVSCGFAGCVTALYFMTGACLWQNGVYYFDIPLPIVLSACALAYVLSGLLFEGEAKHGAIQDSVETVEVAAFGQRTKFRLLLDTGNDLTDPVSGKPVLILEKANAARLLPNELLFLTNGEDADAASLFHRVPYMYRKNFCLIPYCTVGVRGALLLAFRPDKIARQGRRYDALIAFSPQKIAKGRYEGLIGL